VLQARECAPTLSLSTIFTYGLIVESIKELGGALVMSRKGALKENHDDG